MEKKNLIAACMATVGGALFALGMVLALVEEWNLRIAGIVVGSVGLILLVLIYPVYRKVGHYPRIKANRAHIAAYILGVFAALLLGVGLCLVLVSAEPAPWQIVTGICVGMVGIIIAILNPVFNISKKNDEK